MNVTEGPRKQNGFGGGGAEARGGVAEASRKLSVQTVSGIQAELFETDVYDGCHKTPVLQHRKH